MAKLLSYLYSPQKLASIILFAVFIVSASALTLQKGNDKETKSLKMLPYRTFQAGEKLSYSISYGFFDAAEAHIEVSPAIKTKNGHKTYHVVGTAFSKGTFDWFFKVRDRYESYIDTSNLYPIHFVRRVDEGGYKINQDYFFNHTSQTIINEKGKQFFAPSGIQDMVSAFFYARNLDISALKPGDVAVVNSFVDNEFYALKFRYKGKEHIDFNHEKVQCLKFCPLVQKGRVFKHEDDLEVWITANESRIPIRIKANVRVGSIEMNLMSYANLIDAIPYVIEPHKQLN